MTLAQITQLFTRKPRILANVERTIEVNAFVMLNDGRTGTLVSIDLIQGVKRGYVCGEGFAASVVDGEIFGFRNVA